MTPDEKNLVHKMKQLRQTGLTVDNYADMLSMIIEVEDRAAQYERKVLCKIDTRIFKLSRNHYTFKVKENSVLINIDLIWC